MRVEFVGLPGSGKSYLANALIESEGFSDLSISKGPRNRIAALCRYVVVLALNFRIILSVLWSTLRNSSRAELKVVMWQIKLLFRLLILVDRQSVLLKSYSYGNDVVQDQGVLQSILSCRMAGLSISDERVIRLLEMAGLSTSETLFVFHEISSAAAVDALYSRKGQVLPIQSRFSKEDVASYFDTASAVFFDLRELLSKSDWRVGMTHRSHSSRDNLDSILRGLADYAGTQ